MKVSAVSAEIRILNINNLSHPTNNVNQ